MATAWRMIVLVNSIFKDIIRFCQIQTIQVLPVVADSVVGSVVGLNEMTPLYFFQ